MSNTFMIIDDDISIVKMLKSLIEKNNLGKVVGELNSGEHAIEEILFYNPDIVLIDYLMPKKDGVEILREVLNRGYKGKVIMISQVEDQPMIANAYNTGVLFFIKKPINSIEVINIIKNASHNIQLERSMSLIQNALTNVEKEEVSPTINVNTQIENILSDIGIIGDLGSIDLINLIHKIIKYKNIHSNSQYKLHEIYEEMAAEKSKNTSLNLSTSAIEQRIRRMIQKSLSNIAEMGLDDYYNAKFTDYSTLLFDFKQVKQEMNYIENQSNHRGKVSIRKFIEGIISRI